VSGPMDSEMYEEYDVSSVRADLDAATVFARRKMKVAEADGGTVTSLTLTRILLPNNGSWRASIKVREIKNDNHS